MMTRVANATADTEIHGLRPYSGDAQDHGRANGDGQDDQVGDEEVGVIFTTNF
jgi:hypothetical protein